MRGAQHVTRKIKTMQQGEFYFMAVGSFVTVIILGLGMWLDYLTGEKIRNSLKESRKLKSNQQIITWNKFDYSNLDTFPKTKDTVMIRFEDGTTGLGTINAKRITYLYPWNRHEWVISEWAEMPTKIN